MQFAHLDLIFRLYIDAIGGGRPIVKRPLGVLIFQRWCLSNVSVRVLPTDVFEIPRDTGVDFDD